MVCIYQGNICSFSGIFMDLSSPSKNEVFIIIWEVHLPTRFTVHIMVELADLLVVGRSMASRSSAIGVI